MIIGDYGNYNKFGNEFNLNISEGSARTSGVNDEEITLSFGGVDEGAAPVTDEHDTNLRKMRDEMRAKMRADLQSGKTTPEKMKSRYQSIASEIDKLYEKRTKTDLSNDEQWQLELLSLESTNLASIYKEHTGAYIDPQNEEYQGGYGLHSGELFNDPNKKFYDEAEKAIQLDTTRKPGEKIVDFSDVLGQGPNGKDRTKSNSSLVGLNALGPVVSTGQPVSGPHSTQLTTRGYNEEDLQNIAFVIKSAADNLDKAKGFTDEEKAFLKTATPEQKNEFIKKKTLEAAQDTNSKYFAAGPQQKSSETLKDACIKYNVNLGGKLPAFLKEKSIDDDLDAVAAKYKQEHGNKDIANDAEFLKYLREQGKDTNGIDRLMSRLSGAEYDARMRTALANADGKPVKQPDWVSGAPVAGGTAALDSLGFQSILNADNMSIKDSSLMNLLDISKTSKAYKEHLQDLKVMFGNEYQTAAANGWEYNAQYERGIGEHVLSGIENLLDKSDAAIFKDENGQPLPDKEKQNLKKIASRLFLQYFGNTKLNNAGFDGVSAPWTDSVIKQIGPELEAKFGIKLTDAEKQGLEQYVFQKMRRSTITADYNLGPARDVQNK